MSDEKSAKILRHPAWPGIDIDAANLPEKDALFLFEQLEERLKAQLQAYISIQARAVTFAGVLSALSVAVIGGVVALYLQILEGNLTWLTLFPLVATGVVIAAVFVTAMVFSIWVSTPSGFNIVGYFPRDPKSMIDWLNHNREKDKTSLSVFWDALNYGQQVLKNEEKIAHKATLLLLSQRTAVAAFPIGFSLFLILQAAKLWLT